MRWLEPAADQLANCHWGGELAMRWWQRGRSATPSSHDVRRQARESSFAERMTVMTMASRRNAWWVACGAGLLAFAEAAALAGLAPLKTVEPIVITVDRTTGEVNRPVRVREVADYQPEEAIAKSFLHRFVVRRESFLAATAEADFLYVSLFLDQRMKERWATFFRPTNLESPLNFPDGTEVQAEVSSIAFLEEGVAAVHFARRIRGSQIESRTERWTATVIYGFHPAQMRERDLWRNPLGMQVSSYRRDPVVGAK